MLFVSTTFLKQHLLSVVQLVCGRFRNSCASLVCFLHSWQLQKILIYLCQKQGERAGNTGSKQLSGYEVDVAVSRCCQSEREGSSLPAVRLIPEYLFWNRQHNATAQQLLLQPLSRNTEQMFSCLCVLFEERNYLLRKVNKVHLSNPLFRRCMFF